MRASRPRNDSPPRVMDTVGLDIGETNKRNLAQKRIKMGKCPTCGIRLYKMGMFGKKTPLTTEGECVSGRCLRCQPVEGYQIRPAVAQTLPPPEPMGVGRDIVVEDDDDSVMSGITMDPALRTDLFRYPKSPYASPMVGLAEEEEEEDAFPRMLRRPEPSICSGDDFHPVRPNRIQSREPQHQQPGNLIMDPMHSRQTQEMSHPPSPKRPPVSRDLSPRHENMRPVRPVHMPSDIVEETSAQKVSSTGSSELRESGGSSGFEFPAPVTDSNEDDGGGAPIDNAYPPELQYYDEEEKNEIQAPTERFRADPWSNNDANFSPNVSKNLRQDRRNHLSGRTFPEPAEEINFLPHGERPMNGHGGSMRKIPLPKRHQSHALSASSPELHFSPDAPGDRAASRRHSDKLVHPTVRPGHSPTMPQTSSTESDISTIPSIIRLLNSKGSDAKIRADAFRSLANLIWRNGDEAKLMVQRNHGIESIVECMWENLGNARVQNEAVNLLFALSACSQGDMGRDIFMGGNARNAIDALLISMQTHISVESLQRAGCGALGCLASACKENERVDDGTLSGAVSCVVAAMDAHRKSTEVQKWGIWALQCQCVLSRNAENSQMTLAKGASEAGGIKVIFRAMELNNTDMMTLEWGCKLYWSLSYSKEICNMLTESNRTIIVIMMVLRAYQGNQEVEELEEAAYGALANISRIKKAHNWLREAGIIARVFESMDTYHSSESVNTEACALVANLVDSQPLKEAVLTYGVQKIFRAMDAFPNSEELHQEALRSLLCLSVGCEEAKTTLSKEENLEIILGSIARHFRSPSLIETGFAVVASLCVGKSTGSADLSEVVDLLVQAMRHHPNERRLQEVVCLLLRNLSCRDQELIIESPDFFSCLLNVMKSQADSDIVQLNLCCVLTNLLAMQQGITCSTVDEGMNQIVTVIQSHMESAAVLEMACEAIWRLISNSDACKTSFVETGGVEYVKTVLLMHPDSPSTLEKAIGILACLSGSSSQCRHVADDQGICYVVETMRAHSTQLSLIEYASAILKNLVLSNSDNAAEASGGISTIVAALKDNPSATTLQIEACNALWIMAAQSEDCRQKIIALDGQAILLQLAGVDGVEAEAREAISGTLNQISIQSNDVGMPGHDM